MIKVTIRFVSFLISLAFNVTSYAATAESLPGLLWDRYFGDNNLVYQTKFVNLSAHSRELIICGYSEVFSKDRKQSEGVWIWKINEAGSKIAELNIKNVQIDKRLFALDNIRAIAISADDSFLIVAGSNSGSSVLLKASFNGNILWSKYIEHIKNITKILYLPDGNFLLIGEQNGNPFFMKIDATGREIWTKFSSRPQYGVFLDGIVTKEGGFILVENTGATTNLINDTSDIFIAKYNAIGDKLNEKYLPGRYGNIAKGQNDSIAILYDKSTTTAQDTWIQAYNSDLSPIWNMNIASQIIGTEFSMSSLANGNFIVAGTAAESLKTLTYYIDQMGIVKWNYLGKSPEYGLGTQIICKDAVCYLVQSVNTLLNPEYQIKKVRAMKFQP